MTPALISFDRPTGNPNGETMRVEVVPGMGGFTVWHDGHHLGWLAPTVNRTEDNRTVVHTYTPEELLELALEMVEDDLTNQ